MSRVALPGPHAEPPSMLWSPCSNSAKLGPIPVSYVGPTIQHAAQSCLGCPLFDKVYPHRKGPCYAWSSGVRAGHAHHERAAASGHARTLSRALNHPTFRRSVARAARLGALGDPARVPSHELLVSVARLRDLGLAVLGYTHHWREVGLGHLTETLCASTESRVGAFHAHSLGWKTTLVVRPETPARFEVKLGDKTLRGRVCPAQLADDVSCNDCRMCDAQDPRWGSEHDVIGFRAHGHGLKHGEKRGRPVPMARVS